MESFILYIAKAGICLGVFLIIYALFLRPTTFYKFNRAFLILGFIISFIIPSIHYSYDVFIPATTMGGMPTGAEYTFASKSSLNIWNILLVLYITGILALIVRNIAAYRKLDTLVRNGVKREENNIKIIENKNIKAPFSVLNYILLNSQNLSDTEKNLILKHEAMHINQKHWLDLLCSECILLIQWFNPLAWIYVHLLKENHEFLADRAVIDSGVSPAIYQAVLINQRFQGQVFSFSNSFNYSKPLSRLNMIKKTKTSPWKRISALMVIPVFGIFIWVSAVPNYIIETQLLPNISDIPSSDSTKRKTSIIVLGRKDSIKAKPVKKVSVISTSLSEPLYIVDGKKVEDGIKHIDPDNIESISVLKDKNATEYYGEEGKNGVIIVSTKGNESNTKIVDETRSHSPQTVKESASPTFNENEKNNQTPLILVDGKEVSANVMNSISPDNIESINVLKGETATYAYGDKGKYGVILIQTKK